MNDIEILSEYSSIEQHHSDHSERRSNVTSDLSSGHSSEEIDAPFESQGETNPKWDNKLCYKIITCSILFTSITMTAGILIVCLAQSEISKSCHLSFQTLIDENLSQYNSNPYSVAAGDFNHDGFPELVIANFGTNTIELFLNDGRGNFTLQTTFTTGNASGSFSVITGDFNNDTNLDIAVANYHNHSIGIFLGYGNGTFAAQINVSTGVSRPISLATDDFNNDYCLDIIFVNHDTDSIGLLFGYGNGSFGNQTIYSTGFDSHPRSVVIADFNNDDYLDIAVANYGTNNIGIFFGYGNGTLSAQNIYSTNLLSKPSSITMNDLNRDGHIDIAVANSGTDNVGIFLGYGNGSFISQTTYSISPGHNPRFIGIGDFDQDDRLDIVVSNYDTHNISILIGYGNGSFAAPLIFSTGSYSDPLGIVVDDFDNNQQSDIAVVNFATNNVFVLIGYYMMQSPNPTTFSTDANSYLRQIAGGDLNNDSNIDLVAVNSAGNAIHIFLGYGNGSFQEQIEYSTGNPSHPIAVTVADIDGDHQMDILVGNAYIESLGIFYGLGNGTFLEVLRYFTGNRSSVASIAVNDFNNDNYLDIVFADRYTDSIGTLIGYGNRTFGYPHKYSTGLGSRPLSVATGDFNNDGRLDVAAASYGTDQIVIFFGFDNGTFMLFDSFSVGDGSFPFMLTIADLNRDNYSDVVVGNANNDYFSIFFGFGNGSFAAPLSYVTGLNSQPLWVTVVDLNNDCSLDLVVANSNNNNIGVFLGNSSRYFGRQTTYSSGYGSIPYGIVAGDFNKDNRLDIAVMNTGTADVAILLGHPIENSSAETNSTTYNNSKLSSLAFNQCSHDMQWNYTIRNWTSNDVPILLGEYYPNFYIEKAYPTGSSSSPSSVAVGDLNNDKYVDIIVANFGNANLGIFFGYVNGSFEKETIISLYNGARPKEVILDDFNSDKLLDVAVTDPINDCIIILIGNGDGTFSEALVHSIEPGSSPNALVSGDINNDKYLDLLVANTKTNTIGIFFGFDYMLFSKQNSYQTGSSSNPTSLGVGDFNNDGHLDIVSAHFGTNNVGILLGYGNGTFASMITFAYVPASHAWSLAVGDFNNDNRLDITVANWAVNSISILLGYGNGSFAKPVLYSTGSYTHPRVLAVGDVNNDHYLDIAIANYGDNTVCVFLGYGNGSFQNFIMLSTVIGAGIKSIILADVNDDRWLDIITINYGSNQVGVFLGYGNGSFAAQMIFSTGVDSAPWTGKTSDFDQDGRLDIAVANYATSNVGILYGYGNGTFEDLYMYSTGINSFPTYVDVGDFNNDNILDIVVGYLNLNRVGILYGYGDRAFASISIISLEQGSYTYCLVIEDFNKDNRLDFAYANYRNNSIDIFLASGSEPFGGQTTYFVGESSRPVSIAMGHFNNDEQLDIAVVNSGTDNLSILFGSGNRTFSNIANYSTGLGSCPMSAVTGDFNNDSQTDIVVVNSKINNIVVFLGCGNGGFSSLISYSMGEGSQPESVATGDFNNDGLNDIAVANFGTNNICVLFGYGDGTFINQTWHRLKYDARPKYVATKDLNNDSRADIVVASHGLNNVNILLNIC